MDSRTPVLVGAAAATSHDGDADELDLIAEALAAAATDAGVPGLVGRAGLVAVPRGTWRHPDPGRLLAARFGATARTVTGEVGVLQTALIARACAAIAAGEADVAVVAGGEATASARRRGETTRPAPAGAGEGALADEVLAPTGELISPIEAARGLWTPAHQYALIESTLGRSAAALNELWAGWSAIAAANPDAWRREVVDAASLAWGLPSNPPVAYPYGRRHCSQMNVDQAGALILTSVATAEALGVRRDRWAFPWVIAESNDVAALGRRARLDRSPGFAAIAAALGAHLGVPATTVDLVDLYSCFPSAVEVQRREFGFPGDRLLTVTGGMSFAGGPFNNYVVQSTVRAAQLLRDGGGASALVTAISGMISKQGAMWWSVAPPPRGYRYLDVTAAVAVSTPRVPLVDDPDHAAGPGTVVASTVVAGDPPVAWALVDLATGERTLASTSAAEVTAAWTQHSPIGSRVTVSGAELRVG